MLTVSYGPLLLVSSAQSFVVVCNESLTRLLSPFLFGKSVSLSITGVSDHVGSKAKQKATSGGGRPAERLEDPLTTPTQLHPSLLHLLLHHVHTQRQPRERGIDWGPPSARVPLLPYRTGAWPSVNREPCAQPGLLFPWCSAVSTRSLPSRLWEPEPWWAGAAGQTGGAEQVRAEIIKGLTH